MRRKKKEQSSLVFAVTPRASWPSNRLTCRRVKRIENNIKGQQNMREQCQTCQFDANSQALFISSAQPWIQSANLHQKKKKRTEYQGILTRPSRLPQSPRFVAARDKAHHGTDRCLRKKKKKEKGKRNIVEYQEKVG
jgi:hypothetical protein